MSNKDCNTDNLQANSALQKLFVRQQPKVKAKKNMANLLCQFAEDDHKKIAKLIQAWLEKDNS